MTPLVSVIIPTANRPQFLPRAVESALAGMSPGEVEVIVVPNGPDESWRESLQKFAENSQVRVVPIAKAHACAARNHGLALAKGHIIRFLDDDDYLFSATAALQYQAMEDGTSDVVAGSIRAVSPTGQALQLYEPLERQDFCEAAAGSGALYLLHAFVYRKDRLTNIRWREGQPNRQDFFWLLDVCTSGEVTWKRTSSTVGAWQHHAAERITTRYTGQAFYQRQAEGLLEFFNQLDEQGRLTLGRRKAIAEGLWSCVHSAFPYNVHYWSEMAMQAKSIHPASRPTQPLYEWPLIKSCDPLFLQWLLWPKRRWDIHRRASEEREAGKSSANV